MKYMIKCMMCKKQRPHYITDENMIVGALLKCVVCDFQNDRRHKKLPKPMEDIE